jgi:hypothetical protein
LHVGFDLCQFSQFLFWQYCVTAVTELPVEAFEFDVLDGFMSKTADAFTDGSCKFSQCSCCCYLKKKIIENSDLQNNKKERKKEKKKEKRKKKKKKKRRKMQTMAASLKLVTLVSNFQTALACSNWSVSATELYSSLIHFMNNFSISLRTRKIILPTTRPSTFLFDSKSVRYSY